MPFPSIDPVFLKLGPLQFRWYGLMYVLGFILSYFIIRSEVRRRKLELDNEGIADLIFFAAAGVVLGGGWAMCCFTIWPPTWLSH
jgi:phosphatidylglycerol:prolipoprotein diacylglycerol transferase